MICKVKAFLLLKVIMLSLLTNIASGFSLYGAYKSISSNETIELEDFYRSTTSLFSLSQSKDQQNQSFLFEILTEETLEAEEDADDFSTEHFISSHYKAGFSLSNILIDFKRITFKLPVTRLDFFTISLSILFQVFRI
jgi:hypothetical protein